ncbi:up-regulator of cell proliferation-like [Mugil cephalus]|uniref:up-regulator of cell proliferation-like n=1 Tax=Mugil cephalus TaxID=48193 RepID=UPI001FB5E364|nr:up-regulator of cell proliferation-like [Mugil cephalus]XP_047436321.1 up-regulator of cell proliferation-like [Mugil cephalus]
MDTEDDAPQALMSFLSKLGLEKYYPNRLSLQSILEINTNSLNEKPVSSLEDIPWYFLRKLFKISTKCRSCTQITSNQQENNDIWDLDLYTADDSDDDVNFLDLIVALFLCADSFLQQEMSLKMSMCQFSVPLLLPHANKSQCSLMLWALRDIVKEWRPHDLSESKGFVEDNIVQADLPFDSFVRLKNCSLSKSHFLNQVLSSDQQNHNMFIHRDMEGGGVRREISNGLVEVCWYLPCGAENLDIFSRPVAFANMRGDICESLQKFKFIFQVSNVTFVFLDKVEEKELEILTSVKDVNSKLFLVVNQKEGNVKEDMMSVKKTLETLDLPKNNLIVKKTGDNGAKFSKKLCEAIKTCLSDVKATTSIVNMTDKAVELGLFVDENKTDQQNKAAKKIVDGIGVRSILRYKNLQLPLQGDNWKTLSKIEKEECRPTKSGDSALEEYKSYLQEEKEKVISEQRKYKVSKGMETFISNLSTNDKEKRDFFLKWMKLKLDTNSRKELSVLRNKFKEQCKKKDVKQIAELDQALVESSLGVEHYMREMGLIYEFLPEPHHERYHLPSLAAELLLDGYPLELLDGDASNIPERWVTDVLMELHKKVGEKSRLLVLTVLGVQSSGKSTLLNTMFGVQFPVSSGRCTRGAYMLFLKVGEDLKSDLKSDFIVLIDTEGLKSPDLAQLEDSYEHDNQLATFVISLSDVTIVNIAMENSTEMKDVLQITAHAFLRMKEIGKKPICYFVHQNVAAVSADSKCLTERKHLLDQLNEMTQIAAVMEKQPSIKAFTDVLDYDIDKNNWNIPGLWHGTPPMAPVNTGYSEAVAEFKKHLLETMKGDRRSEPSQIPEFLEWMRSLWKAVKYENFIFSFRNTLVAHAYDNLCKEFSDWEWEFRKEILSWQTEAEVEILKADNESEPQHLFEMVERKKQAVLDKIEVQQQLMKQKLDDYYKRKNVHENLIEKYKTDFFNSVNSLANEIRFSVHSKLNCVLELKKSLEEVQNIQRKHREMIEEHVRKFLTDFKERTRSTEQLTCEFEKMWTKATEKVSGLPEQNIPEKMLDQLKKHFSNRNVSEYFQNIGDLQQIGMSPFKVTTEHIKTGIKNIVNVFIKKDITRELQTTADTIIESCNQFVYEITQTNTDYVESYTKDLLDKIDESIEQIPKDCKLKFEVDLKLHICGFASREFLKMHKKFLSDRNPKTQLEKYKDQCFSDFVDLYKQGDQTQKKANYFVKFCLKPAVKDYMNRSLGIDIVDEVLTSSHSAEFSSRSYFQYNIQTELLQKEDFQSFVKYISSYEIYVKEWIFQHIFQTLSEEKTLCKLRNKSLEVIVQKTEAATEHASKGEDGVLLPDNTESITKFFSNMRKYLIKYISISVEAEKSTLFHIQSTCHPFIQSLKISIEEMKAQLQEEFSKSENITETLNKLPIKPQDELFKRVFGCGKQCPFCKVPCEAGGKEHPQHHAAVHWPRGLSGFRYIDSQKLMETLCTTDVYINSKFKNTDTKGEWHPYKKYHTYYPDWHIPPDPTLESSDYWKYILVKYNDRFAEKYEAKPADVPEAWKRITKEQALKGLKDAFSIK